MSRYRRCAAKRTTTSLLRRVARAGFPQPVLRETLLPDWWNPSCAKDPALLPEVEVRVARFLGVPLAQVQDPKQELKAPSYPSARLRKVKNIGEDRVGPAIHFGLRLASAVVRTSSSRLPMLNLPPADPVEWRRELTSANKIIDLEVVADDLWRRGIPVVHVEISPSPRFQGLACIVDGRPAVLIGHDIDAPARLLSHAIHEVGHIVHGDCEAGAPVVDEDDEVRDRDEMEQRADQYALVTAVGRDRLPAAPSSEDFKHLASVAARHARERRVDPGALLWAWAPQIRDYGRVTMALKALYRDRGGARILRRLFDQYVDIAAASDTDRTLLRSVKGDAERDAAAG